MPLAAFGSAEKSRLCPLSTSSAPGLCWVLERHRSWGRSCLQGTWGPGRGEVSQIGTKQGGWVPLFLGKWVLFDARQSPPPPGPQNLPLSKDRMDSTVGFRPSLRCLQVFKNNNKTNIAVRGADWQRSRESRWGFLGIWEPRHLSQGLFITSHLSQLSPAVAGKGERWTDCPHPSEEEKKLRIWFSSFCKEMWGLAADKLGDESGHLAQKNP